MVKCLVELRPVLTDMTNPDVTRTELQWKKLKELEDLIRLPFKAIKKLQEYLTPKIFLKEWKMLEHSLTNKSGLPVEMLYASMKQRKVHLIQEVQQPGAFCKDFFKWLTEIFSERHAFFLSIDQMLKSSGYRLGEEGGHIFLSQNEGKFYLHHD